MFQDGLYLHGRILYKKLSISLGLFLVLATSMAFPIGFAASKGGGGGGTPNQFSGRATAVSVHTSLADLVFADTGELPSSGGESDATVLTVTSSLVQAEVLLSVTMGFDSQASSAAAVADLVLLPGTPNQITADFVRSDTKVTCTSVSASSEIVNLRLLGSTIVVTGEANQVVTIPGVATLMINSVSTSQGSTNTATAVALDLKLFTGDEVKVSFAHSDITCGTLPPPKVKKDFMTGGGFIIVNGAHANFGFVAGFKPGKTTVSGQLNYIDHSSSNHVKSTTVTAYSGSGACRTFSGPGTVNGQSVNFTVNACDNAEPGNGSDTFGIQLSNGYSASGILAGGNIQLRT